MRWARVKTLLVVGAGGRSFQSQDLVNENQFPAGHFDKLLKDDALMFDHHDAENANPAEGEVEFHETEREEKPQGMIEAEEKKAHQEKLEKTGKENQAARLQENDLTEDTDTIQEPTVSNIEDTTRDEIKADLDKAGVKYSKNSSKAELYELWRLHRK
jgi:hypothetical protein